MTPNLLAFDTSTEVLAVSVCSAREPGRIFSANAPGGALASTQLLPLIERQLAAAGLALAELDAIAFGRGPGAFTGLRASCAVAQGLGLGAHKPLLPLDSLLVVAEDAFGAEPEPEVEGEPALYAVAMDARMDEVYGALFHCRAGAWSTVRPGALYTLQAWNAELAALPPPLAGAGGSALAAFGARLAWPGGPGQARPPRLVAVETDRAAALMRLAQSAWLDGRAVDAAEALPLYLRDKVALTSIEREAQRRGARAGEVVRT